MGFDSTRTQTREDAIAQETRKATRRLVAQSALRAVPFNIVNATLLSVLIYTHVDPMAHLGWYTALVCAAIARVAAMWRARRADRLPTDSEMTTYIILSAIVGVCWGLTPFMIGPDAPTIVAQITAMVIAGMAAGAVMTAAGEQRVILAYTVPALGLWALSMGLNGSMQAVLGAVMLIGFFIAMNALSRTYSGTLTQTVHAKIALEEAQRHTEAQAAAMARLAEHNDQAARRAEVEAKSNAAVLANMSHELRAPLNGVLGMAQLLEESGLNTDQTRMAARIRESGEALNNLLSDVLDVARIEAGRLDLVVDDMTVADLGEKISRMASPQAAEKGLAFEVQVAGEPDRAMRADAERIGRLCDVFVSNAIRFTESGGVTATLTSVFDAAGGVRLRVEVRDTGVGVPESARAHLFDAMSADKMDPNIREAGTGLGLHLAKRLAELMNGEVGYAPSETGGSTFWFEVNLRASLKADRYVGGEQLTLEHRRLRILVAERDAARRSVLLGYLKSFNCVVSCSSSSQDMLEGLGAAAYDAVVLGLELDDCEPEDASADVRSLPSTAAMTPVLRLSADLAEPVIDTAVETLVRAPVSADALLGGLQKALSCDPVARARLQRIA